MTLAFRLESFAVAALACVLLGGAGCYNPSVTTGGFKCSSEFIKDCPDGFKCVSGRCWKGGIVGDASVPDVAADVPVDKPVDKPTSVDATDAVESKPEVACTIKPVAGCTPQSTGKCDPMCNTGCDGCVQKCSVNTLGALTCNAPPASPSGLAMEGDTCEPISPGTESQTDVCAPGLVCAELFCKKACAKICRVDADCPGSTCSRQYAPGFKVCDVKNVECNPAKVKGDANCPASAQACYLSTTVTDATICDCPGNAFGVGQLCRLSRECLPGLACVDATGTTEFRCQIVCSLEGAQSGCMGTQICRPILGSTKYGFCRI